jgi:hypothetical protein
MIVSWSCRRSHPVIQPSPEWCQRALVENADARATTRNAACSRRADQEEVLEKVSGQPCKRICRASTGPRVRQCMKNIDIARPSFLGWYDVGK